MGLLLKNGRRGGLSRGSLVGDRSHCMWCHPLTNLPSILPDLNQVIIFHLADIPKHVQFPLYYHLYKIPFWLNLVSHHNICNFLLPADLKCPLIIFHLGCQYPLLIPLVQSVFHMCTVQHSILVFWLSKALIANCFILYLVLKPTITRVAFAILLLISTLQSLFHVSAPMVYKLYRWMTDNWLRIQSYK